MTFLVGTLPGLAPRPSLRISATFSLTSDVSLFFAHPLENPHTASGFNSFVFPPNAFCPICERPPSCFPPGGGARSVAAECARGVVAETVSQCCFAGSGLTSDYFTPLPPCVPFVRSGGVQPICGACCYTFFFFSLCPLVSRKVRGNRVWATTPCSKL